MPRALFDRTAKARTVIGNLQRFFDDRAEPWLVPNLRENSERKAELGQRRWENERRPSGISTPLFRRDSRICDEPWERAPRHCTTSWVRMGETARPRLAERRNSLHNDSGGCKARPPKLLSRRIHRQRPAVPRTILIVHARANRSFAAVPVLSANDSCSMPSVRRMLRNTFDIRVSPFFQYFPCWIPSRLPPATSVGRFFG